MLVARRHGDLSYGARSRVYMYLFFVEENHRRTFPGASAASGTDATSSRRPPSPPIAAATYTQEIPGSPVQSVSRSIVIARLVLARPSASSFALNRWATESGGDVSREDALEGRIHRSVAGKLTSSCIRVYQAPLRSPPPRPPSASCSRESSEIVRFFSQRGPARVVPLLTLAPATVRSRSPKPSNRPTPASLLLAHYRTRTDRIDPRAPSKYLKSLLHLRRGDRAVIVLVLLSQRFQSLLFSPLLLQLLLLLPELRKQALREAVRRVYRPREYRTRRGSRVDRAREREEYSAGLSTEGRCEETMGRRRSAPRGARRIAPSAPAMRDASRRGDERRGLTFS